MEQTRGFVQQPFRQADVLDLSLSVCVFWGAPEAPGDCIGAGLYSEGIIGTKVLRSGMPMSTPMKTRGRFAFGITVSIMIRLVSDMAVMVWALLHRGVKIS